MQFFMQGFLLGLAYVAPIGAQNMYVINSAVKLRKRQAYKVSTVTIFFDISLAFTCFMGVGILLDKYTILKEGILFIGSIIVFYIGISLIRGQVTMNQEIDVNQPLYKTAIICFSVTWLNPQAIIDGSLLLGGFRASLPPVYANLFILGVMAASFTWFIGLTTAISTMKSVLNVRILKGINIICGIVVLCFGFKLLYRFICLMR